MPMVRRAHQADEDLIEVWLYIAQDNPSVADHWLDEIEDKFLLLAEQPRLGVARSDIAQGLRYFPIGNYLILYREDMEGVEIVRVVHGTRRLSRLF